MNPKRLFALGEEGTIWAGYVLREAVFSHDMVTNVATIFRLVTAKCARPIALSKAGFFL